MRITKRKLRRIIREEKRRVLAEINWEEEAADLDIDPAIRTVGDLRKIIKTLQSEKRGKAGIEGLKDLGMGMRADLVPGGGTALTIAQTLKAMYGAPDEKKTDTMLLLSSLLLALPTGAADLTEALLLLRAGREYEALQALEALDPTDETRFWVLRTWIELGRYNDTLDAVEGLVAGGAEGSRVDYLFGMALHGKGSSYLDQGVRDNSVGMAFSAALSYLLSATDSDPEAFADVWVPLAESAWYSEDLIVAREAEARADLKRVLRESPDPLLRERAAALLNG